MDTFSKMQYSTVLRTPPKIHFCCPGCGLQFVETTEYSCNTIHQCPADIGVLTYVASPSEKLKEKKDEKCR